VPIRNAVALGPVPPAVAPVVAMPTPPAASGYQLDGRRGAKLDRVRGQKRGRLYGYGRQRYPTYERYYHSAHLSLHEGCKAHCTGAVTNRS
jgi:hypothetical protein